MTNTSLLPKRFNRSSHSGLRALAKLILFGKKAPFTSEESDIVEGVKPVVVDSKMSEAPSSLKHFYNHKKFSPTVSQVLKHKKQQVNSELERLKSKYTTPDILSKFLPSSQNLMLTHE